MTKELTRSLQLYAAPTYRSGIQLFSKTIQSSYSSASNTAVSVYRGRFPLESSTSVSLYQPRRSLNDHLLIHFISGLLNGVSHYALHKLSLKLQKIQRVRSYFPGHTLPIKTLESFTHHYMQLVPLFDLSRDSFQFPLSINAYFSALLITLLQYRLGAKYSMLGRMYLIQFLTTLVLFLSTLASIFYSSDQSDNPLQAMAEYTLHFMSKMATEGILKYWENPTEPLLQAIKYNYPTIARLLIATGVSQVNGLGESEITPTPLHLAVYYNRKEIVSLILDAGANPNARNRFGDTPLHLANTSQTLNIKIVTELIAKRANVNAINHFGETPLFQAVLFFSRNEIIKELLAAGADLNIASVDSAQKTLTLLRIRGIDLNILTAIKRANQGFTPLCVAALTFNTKPNNERVKKILILLIQAYFLFNPLLEKPDFIQKIKPALRLWDECTAEIKRLKNPISNTSISLWDVCIEKDVSKLADMVKNEALREQATLNNFAETYSYFNDRFQLNFKKGMQRARMLGMALSTVSFWNIPSRTSQDCWIKILNYLDEESLDHIAQVSLTTVSHSR